MPDIREQLEAKGLGRIAGVIETAVKPSLWLATREESENGVSRLGGRPNLPEEFDWPLWQEQPLAFLAQLNLAALPAVDGLNLPREGALFFFQAAGRDEGWDGVRVLYSDRAVDQSPLREFPDELEAELRFRGFELAVREMVPSIPDFTDQLIEEQQLTEEELDAYQDVAFEWRQRWSEEHRAGGYPDAIQCQDPKAGSASQVPRLVRLGPSSGPAEESRGAKPGGEGLGIAAAGGLGQEGRHDVGGCRADLLPDSQRRFEGALL